MANHCARSGSLPITMLRAEDPPALKPLETKTARQFLPTSCGKHEIGALKFFERMHPKLSEPTLDVIKELHGLEPFHVSDLRRQSDEGFAEIGITNREDINAIRRPVRTVEVRRYVRPASRVPTVLQLCCDCAVTVTVL